MNDNEDFSIEEAVDIAKAMFQNVAVVLQFAESHKDSIISVFPRKESGHRDNCVKGLWYRAYCWLQSLPKLNSPSDFQLFASANRGLMEITVDLALLHQDKTNSSGWKMFQWNLSDKLKGAEAIIRYLKENNIEVSDQYSEYQEFISSEKDNILRIRNAIWKKDEHPKRWTGKGNLFDELKEVDEVLKKSIVELFGMSLSQYYRTEYKRMSWYVHSGVSGIWNMPEESYPLLGAFFLNGCANFGLLSTHIVLKDLGLDKHLPNYHQELKTLEQRKLQNHFSHLEKWRLKNQS